MLHVLAEARLEGAEASLWYEDQRIGLGEQFLAALQAAFDRIADDPSSLARLEMYSGRYDVRRYRLKGFPYGVIFYIQGEDVVVVAVCHARRRPLYWVERLR
ncbi:MAG: type II toxin-antitoxin system RelE/ParE family toxin [Planctomycetaceae bacterium]|nr:type II toxin-antitoxin system RelE/ParE family toxin [Planctomycetaceae bacterium]